MSIQVNQSGKHGGDGGNSDSADKRAPDAKKDAESNVSIMSRTGQNISVTQSGAKGMTSDNAYVNVNGPSS